MYLARILYPVTVLGPGRRVGIWFCGCPHRCDGCSNPELWELDERHRISLSQAVGLIEKICAENSVDGFTITGGEPFYQASELSGLVAKIGEISQDIIVYSGYTISQLRDMNSPDVEAVLNSISVLIDGKYIKEQNTNVLIRGSENQVLHVLNQDFRAAYEEFSATEENKIQNFFSGSAVVSVGIHKSDFAEEFPKKTAEKGLISGGKNE
ncbi:MAG: 4Fe-4S single cluster domain-containing protein [Oscillospiraceae bacterium]|jgi:anaerobic ribonucleoside-triphosphate reductase activating protein